MATPAISDSHRIEPRSGTRRFLWLTIDCRNRSTSRYCQYSTQVTDQTRLAAYTRYREYYDGARLRVCYSEVSKCFRESVRSLFAYNRCAAVVRRPISDRLRLTGFDVEGEAADAAGNIDPTANNQVQRGHSDNLARKSNGPENKMRFIMKR